MIAALFVARGGAYWELDGVDAWDDRRDARLYDGDMRVVAHPPCSSWCQLARLNEKRWGRKVGDDGGCFESALRSVLRCGGILEHPAETIAWKAHGLPRPTHGCWTRWGLLGDAWVTEVQQGAYGHSARKRTWLLAVSEDEPRAMNWSTPAPKATVSFLRNHGGGRLQRLTKKQAKATPVAFRDALLSIARGDQ
jgi:hypothetical protein